MGALLGFLATVWLVASAILRLPSPEQGPDPGKDLPDPPPLDPDPPATRRLTVGRLPVRIHLEPWPEPGWTDPEAVDAFARTLVGLGFVDVGSFTFRELSGMKLRVLLRPDDALNGTLIERPDGRTFVEFYTRYQDDGGFSIVNDPVAPRISRLPDRVCVFVDSRDALDLYRRILEERPRRPLRAITPETFVASYERAWADSVDWRNSRGGFTEDDLRVLAEARGLEFDDAMIADCRRRGEMAALEDFDRGLRERYADREGFADERREAILPRLVPVHDGHPPLRVASRFSELLESERRAAEAARDSAVYDEAIDETGLSNAHALLALPPRAAFAALNDLLPEPDRLAKLGELDWPVSADIYLAPKCRRTARPVRPSRETASP